MTFDPDKLRDMLLGSDEKDENGDEGTENRSEPEQSRPSPESEKEPEGDFEPIEDPLAPIPEENASKFGEKPVILGIPDKKGIAADWGTIKKPAGEAAKKEEEKPHPTGSLSERLGAKKIEEEIRSNYLNSPTHSRDEESVTSPEEKHAWGSGESHEVASEPESPAPRQDRWTSRASEISPLSRPPEKKEIHAEDIEPSIPENKYVKPDVPVQVEHKPSQPAVNEEVHNRPPGASKFYIEPKKPEEEPEHTSILKEYFVKKDIQAAPPAMASSKPAADDPEPDAHEPDPVHREPYVAMKSDPVGEPKITLGQEAVSDRAQDIWNADKVDHKDIQPAKSGDEYSPLRDSFISADDEDPELSDEQKSTEEQPEVREKLPLKQFSYRKKSAVDEKEKEKLLKPKKKKKAGKKGEIEYARTPGPLSLLALLAGGLSLLAAVIAMQMNVGTTPTFGLTGLGILLVGTFTMVNGAWVREALSSRSARYSTNVTIAIASFLGILVLFNILSYRYYHKFDLSAEGVHTLSPQSQQVLADINRAGEKVTVYAFVSTKDAYRQIIDNLLDQYTYHTNLLDIQFVDPDVKRELTQENGIEVVPSVLFQLGETKKIVSDIDEPHFTFALLAVRESHSPIVYFLTGHDEPDPYSTRENGLSELRERLELENYVVDNLSIPEESGVPIDTAILVIAAPRRNLSTLEVNEIEKYLDNGGNLICLLEPGYDAGLTPLLSKYGILVQSGVVLDDEHNYFSELASPIVIGNPESEITRTNQDDFMDMIFLNSSSLQYTNTNRYPNVNTQSLAKTYGSAWVETGDEFSYTNGMDKRDFQEMALFAIRALDVEEPVTQPEPEPEVETVDDESPYEGNGHEEAKSEEVPAPVEQGPVATKVAQVMVVGDSSFAQNANFEIYYNRDFILNAVNHMTSQSDLVSIRPAVPKNRPLDLTGVQKSMIFILSVVLTPLGIAGLGGYVWWKRK
ncbi:MAG TPA: DUF4350 domain-containing protein [bacterium]